MFERQTKAGNQEFQSYEKLHPWDMLNNFCFHVYAQKSLFIGDMAMLFFGYLHNQSSPSPVSLDFKGHRAGSQLKMVSCHDNPQPSQLNKV